MSDNSTFFVMNVTPFLNSSLSSATSASQQNDIRADTRNEWTGLATIIANFLLILIITTDRGLRERLALYSILAIGDIINGTYFFYANFNRLREIQLGTFYRPMSIWDCTMKFYTLFQLIGTQFPALIALLISLERFFAVQKPIWYHTTYKNKHRLVAICISAALVAIFLSIHYATSYPLTEISTTSQYCPLTYSSPKWYNRAHQAFITVTRVTGFGLSTFAFIQASKKSRTVAAMRREAVKIAPILAVSAISVTLVTIPQLGLLLTDNFKAYPIFNQLQLVQWILLLTCINSLTNIFIYFFFTRDFRRRVIFIVTLRKVKYSKTWIQNATLANPRRTTLPSSQNRNPVITLTRTE